MSSHRQSRISDADRPSWPLLVSAVSAVYLMLGAVQVIRAPSFLDGAVFGLAVSMLILTFTIGPRREAYERHLSEAVCDHRRDGEW